MAKKTVEVTLTVEIEYDEDKFSPEFMAEFRGYMFSFETVEQHLKHLAQMQARGLCDSFKPFAEGYGDLGEFGLKMDIVEQEEEILE